eukprot:CAMPEP_0205903552 /NCGR_PEP_ID=MMETSP1325-20131115/174_1 /ASSEMBLY_ACC=CAM_ASM_000708 /TAXON_ID=236786 /ORGANISM="Florenciella sp., Strain RCC1007" /LENGTH=102 /DNA_ID=CAMNT_0053269215 /DNA_START=66 /DNA_END=374 /DNA_ORIENTATION=-
MSASNSRRRGLVARIQDVGPRIILSDKTPQRAIGLVRTALSVVPTLTLGLGVAQERREPTRIQPIDDQKKELLRELECSRELTHNLVHAIEPLEENRTCFMR